MSCLNFVLCNSQLPASWIFFAAFSLRLLSLLFLVRPIATLWCNWVKVPFLQFWSRSPKNCTKRPKPSPTPNSSECYFWSFRGISCLANSSTSSLLLTTFTKHSFSIDWYTMRRCCLPKFVLASRTSEFSTLHSVQRFNEFGDSPPSFFFVSVICSLHWHCGRHKLHTHTHRRGNVCLPSVRVCTLLVQLLSFYSAYVECVLSSFVIPSLCDTLFSFVVKHHVIHRSKK